MKNKVFTLVLAWLFALAALVAPQVPAYGQEFDVKTKQAVTSDFNNWRVFSISTTSVAAGSATVQVETPYVTIPGRNVINPIVANSTLLVDPLGANPETVTVSSVSCSSATACTFTATFSNAHTGRFQIKSGSYGLQEAIDYVSNKGGKGRVVVAPGYGGTSSTQITSAVRGSTSIAVEDMSGGTEVFYGWNGSNYTNQFGIPAAGGLTLQGGLPQFVKATATSTAGATYTPITGLSWTIPANTAITYPFHCVISWTQATAATANAFQIQTATNAPTAGTLNGLATTAATAVVRATATAYSSTSATTIVTATPGAAGTQEQVTLDGLIVQPSSSSTSGVTVGVATTSGATDVTTVSANSYCRLN